VLLFFSTTFLIVYLFPKSGKFKYNFDKGKPWQSENLYAPFDFAIKKTAEELEKEQLTITQNSPVYFEINPDTKQYVFQAYSEKFSQSIPDSIVKRGDNIYDLGQSILERIYAYGVLDEDYNYSGDQTVKLIENQTQKESTQYSKLTSLNAFRNITEQELEKAGLSKYGPNLISIYFDIIKPNITINKSLSDNALKEELGNISHARGSIDKGTLIISKGEIVDIQGPNSKRRSGPKQRD
jgi:membrane-associated HD superfamily phosphohydrolase